MSYNNPDTSVKNLETYFVKRGVDWVNASLCLIAETTLGAPTAPVTFAAIPQTFRNLLVITNTRSTRAATSDTLAWRANADAGNNYDTQYYGVVNAAFSGANAIGATLAYAGFIEAANSLANAHSPNYILFPNYTSTTMQKFSLSMTAAYGTPAAATMQSHSTTGRWKINPIAAITSLTITILVGPNFAAGSIFQLYGIL